VKDFMANSKDNYFVVRTMSRDFVDDEINILQQMYTANMH